MEKLNLGIKIIFLWRLLVIVFVLLVAYSFFPLWICGHNNDVPFSWVPFWFCGFFQWIFVYSVFPWFFIPIIFILYLFAKAVIFYIIIYRTHILNHKLETAYSLDFIEFIGLLGLWIFICTLIWNAIFL